jgi:hypothetical protein
MAATESTVTIRVGGGDISSDVIYAQTQFGSAAAAQPGTCSIAVRDLDGTRSFSEGSIIELLIDGTRRWRGYLMELERTYVFEDNEEVRAWVLQGVDLNIILDKLILYNRTNPTRYPDGGGTYRRRKVTYNGQTFGYQVTVPQNTDDDEYIRAMMADFDLDLISPTIRYSGSDNKISRVGQISPDGAFTPPTAGVTLRNFLVDVSRNVQRSTPGSTIWYIDPDGYLVYTAQDLYDAPFWVGDDDPATYYNGVQGENVRNLRIGRSISNLKNDVLIFAGELDPRPSSRQTRLRYRHRIAQWSVEAYGRFQYSEVLQNSWLQGAVNARAQKIITQEATPGGTATFTTFRSGLYPGQILNVVSTAHDVEENFPIRAVTMSFPLPTLVRYDVTCSYDTQDPWGLILALKRPVTRGLKQPDFEVIDLRRNPDQTKVAERFSYVKEYPASLGNNLYQTSFPYIRNSISVFVGGLRQVSAQDPVAGTVAFKEYPTQGTFQLSGAPSGKVYCEYHAQGDKA